MREIKFRAWEPVKREMMVAGKISFWFQACAETGKNPLHERPHTILMQYTGLKDKLGKEIYEGDILENKSVVCFGDGKFHPRYDGGMAEDEEDPFNGNEREIIGNIYENPELINPN